MGRLRQAGVDGDPPVVRLSEPGQSLAYTPAEPPEAGRVGVNFRDRDAAGGRWLAELRFQGDGEARTLRVTLAGPGDAYEVEPPGMGGDAHRVVRSPGWHRLEVRFSRDSLAVLCDDAVLWSDLHRGPGGTLRQVSLTCVEEAKSGEARGRVEFAEFALTRSVDEPPRPPGDPGQDEIWLADGDQLFGDVPSHRPPGRRTPGTFRQALAAVVRRARLLVQARRPAARPRKAPTFACGSTPASTRNRTYWMAF